MVLSSTLGLVDRMPGTESGSAPLFVLDGIRVPSLGCAGIKSIDRRGGGDSSSRGGEKLGRFPYKEYDTERDWKEIERERREGK